jgi:hypothetical protein
MIHVSTRTNHSVASFAFVAHRESCSQVPGTRPKFEEPRLSEVRSQHFLRQRLSCLRRSLQLPHLSFKVQLITIYRSFKLFEFQFDKIAPFQETHHLTYVPTRTTQSSPPLLSRPKLCCTSQLRDWSFFFSCSIHLQSQGSRRERESCENPFRLPHREDSVQTR